MGKAVTFAKVERALEKAGFIHVSTGGKQQVFRHEATNAVVVLPPRVDREHIDAAHLTAIEKTLEETGVMDREGFELLLQKV